MARPMTLVFLVDALGWEVAEHFAFGRDRFALRAGLGTVLGYSSAAIPSLLSGVPPNVHGSWSMFRLAPARGTFSAWRWIPRLPHALDWRARRLIRRHTDRRGRVAGYYDLYEVPAHLLHRFDVAAAGDPFLPGGLPRETVFDWMNATGVPYRLWYYRTPEEDNFAQARAALAENLDVLFVYTAELDALMHRVGVFQDAVGARLDRYEQFLEEMQQSAGAHDVDLTIVLLSDHGMTDVTDTVDVWGAMEARGLRLGRDYLAFFDSTMARLWAEPDVVATMRAAFGDRGRLLTAAELNSLGCHFADGEYGTSVFLAEPGALIVPSFMGSRAVAAMHGYHPEDRFSRGCFMSTAQAPLPASILGFKAYLQALVGGR